MRLEMDHIGSGSCLILSTEMGDDVFEICFENLRWMKSDEALVYCWDSQRNSEQ